MINKISSVFCVILAKEEKHQVKQIKGDDKMFFLFYQKGDDKNIIINKIFLYCYFSKRRKRHA